MRDRSNGGVKKVKGLTWYAPTHYVRCPVHLSLVGFDGEGRMLGRCDSCTDEAARAIRSFNKRRRSHG